MATIRTTSTPTHAEHLAHYAELEGLAARYGITLRPGGRDNRHLEAFAGTRRLGLIHGAYSLEDWTGPYVTMVSVHVDAELAAGNRRRSVDYFDPRDALDLLARYAHLELGPEPTAEAEATRFPRPDRFTPTGTLVAVGPGWPMSRRIDHHAGRWLVGDVRTGSAGVEVELLEVDGTATCTIVPAEWLTIADDDPHPVTLLPYGTLPVLEAELETFDQLAADLAASPTVPGDQLAAAYRSRARIIGELLEVAAGVAEERRQAVANAYTARRVVEAAR